jgi:hypothetical protein
MNNTGRLLLDLRVMEASSTFIGLNIQRTEAVVSNEVFLYYVITFVRLAFW